MSRYNKGFEHFFIQIIFEVQDVHLSDPAKMVAIKNLRPPATAKEVKSTLCLAGYVRRYIPRQLKYP